MNFEELHALTLRGHRVGICRWRELAIRRLRSRFLGVWFPHDFEYAFRNSELLGLNPDINPSGPVGRPASRGRMASGVEDPMEYGESLVDWAVNDDSPNSDRVNVSLRSSPAPTSLVRFTTTTTYHLPMMAMARTARKL